MLQDDFDISAEDEQTLEVKDQPEVQEKLARRVRSVQVGAGFVERGGESRLAACR